MKTRCCTCGETFEIALNDPDWATRHDCPKLKPDGPWRPCVFHFNTGEKADRWEGECDGSKWNGFDNVRVRPAVHAQIVAYFNAEGYEDEGGVHEIPEVDGWHDYSGGYVTSLCGKFCDCGHEPRKETGNA